MATIMAGFSFCMKPLAVPKSSSQRCYIGERNMTEKMATNLWMHLSLQNAQTGVMKPCRPVTRNRYTP